MVLVLWVRLQTFQTRGSVHQEAVGDEEEDEAEAQRRLDVRDMKGFQR